MMASMYHEQSCCEEVWLEDVCGDPEDLIETPILFADEAISEGISAEYDSMTWTFYRIRTINGTVALRWCGTSNGCYSEDVTVSVRRP